MKPILPLLAVLLTVGCPHAAPRNTTPTPPPSSAGQTGGGDLKVETQVKPEDPNFHGLPEPPAESPAETATREYWNVQPRFVGGLIDPAKNSGVPLLDIPYGSTVAEVEKKLPVGFTPVTYTNDNITRFEAMGVTFATYNFATEWAPNPKPMSGPGSGGKEQLSPRLTCYYLNGGLVGADLNITDLAITDADLIKKLVDQYGLQNLTRGQNPNQLVHNYMKTIAEMWTFGTKTTESNVELTVMYLGPNAGAADKFLDTGDRLYGRLLRCANPALFRINMRMKEQIKNQLH